MESARGVRRIKPHLALNKDLVTLLTFGSDVGLLPRAILHQLGLEGLAEYRPRLEFSPQAVPPVVVGVAVRPQGQEVPDHDLRRRD